MSSYLNGSGGNGEGRPWSERFATPLSTTGGRSPVKRRVPREEKRRVVTCDGRYVVCRVAANMAGLSLTVVCQWSKVLLWGHVVPACFLDDATEEEVKEMAATFFRKPPVQKRDGSGGADPTDPAFEKKYPTLWAYISKIAFPDGEVRKRSTLIVFAEDGMVKACLSDKDTESSLWAASGTFTGVLEALEGRLTEDSPEWRAAKKKK